MKMPTTRYRGFTLKLIDPTIVLIYDGARVISLGVNLEDACEECDYLIEIRKTIKECQNA